MYVLALSDYKQPAAAAGYKPAPQLGRFKYSFGSGMHTFPYIYFTFPIFIFHVSFLLYNSLIIIVFCGWNIRLQRFTLYFNLSVVSLAPRFEISCTKVCSLLHYVLIFLPQCFRFFFDVSFLSKMKHKNETLKHKMKHRVSMFHLLLLLIINAL